jgi:hypothetical protein
VSEISSRIVFFSNATWMCSSVSMGKSLPFDPMEDSTEEKNDYEIRSPITR